jgi:iron complex outermembrane recepter protein
MKNWQVTCAGVALSLLSSGALSQEPPVAAEQTITLNISEQPLGTALAEFAQKAGLQLAFYSEIGEGFRAPRLAGRFSRRAALDQLLAHTPLSYEFLDARTVAIRAKEPSTAVPAELEEVVVTAQKRAERLIDTPQSVSVLSSEYLSRLGATQFRDYANTVPGLSFTTAGAGYTQISLRGVTAGVDVGSTVGIYVDEVPYGSSSAFAGGHLYTLDVGLFDVERIEVLRGPQGTLYGASTMGGLIKYVTPVPDASRFGVDLQASLANTTSGDVSYNGAATVNAPLVPDKAALRASGFYSRDGGYIDNLARNEADVNSADIYGGRLDLAIEPNDALDIRLSAFLQNVSRNGDAIADYTLAGDPIDGHLDQRHVLPETLDQRFRLVSATIGYDLGSSALTSISSYQTMELDNVADLSLSFYPGFCAFINAACSAFAGHYETSIDKFTQEIRLASVGSREVEWLVGAFYTHESAQLQTGYLMRDLAGQPVANTLLSLSTPTKFDEYALFGDLTWHLTDAFDVTGGVRHARNEQDYTQNGGGLFGLSTPTRSASDRVSTYLLNARYRINERSTAYVRFATGYRPGGPNFVAPVAPGQPAAPPTFDADELKSYEIGYRADTMDRRFGIDVAAYHIDWSDIHVNVVRGGFSAVENASGGATVRGAELTLSVRPVPAFNVTGTFAYQNGKLSEAEPELGALTSGARLPNVPRFTGAFNADYELPLGTLRPTIGVTVRHVSERKASFDNSVSYLQYTLPEYTMVDLRAGFTLGAVDTRLYVRNLFDEVAELSALNWRGPAMPTIAQPRTIGVTASIHF